MTLPEGARTAPAVARNRMPLLDVLRPRLVQPGLVLEVASGTGEHAVFFAQEMPGLAWQPTDRDPSALESIEAWRVKSGLPNVLPPLRLDVAEAGPWPVGWADAVVSCNMIHISPWESAMGLFRGAAGVLPAGGALILYGPFKEGGVHTAPSNAAFDESLRARDPSWGVRDLDVVADLAAEWGFALAERIPMPANNLTVVFRRQPG